MDIYCHYIVLNKLFYVLYFINIYWENLISEVFEFSCFKAFYYIMDIQNVLDLKTYTWK